MFENDLKGSHGSFSYAGRSSAEKYHMIINKDKIINKHKTKKIEDYFLNEDEKYDEYMTKRGDIFDTKLIQMNKKERLLKNKRRHKKDTASFPKNCRFTNKTKPFSSNFIYNPKIDFVMKRTVTGPKWNTIKGREIKIQTIRIKTNSNTNINTNANANNILTDYYITLNDPLSSIGKTFVRMDKQTQRGQFSSSHDVRIRNEKPFSPSHKSKKKLKPFQSEDNQIKETNINSQYDSNNNIQTNQNSFGYKCTLSERGIGLRLRISDKLNPVKSNKKSARSLSELIASTTESALINASTTNIKAPDFSRTISRKQLNHINRDRNPLSPFFIPNYSMVQERPLSMVTYDRSIHPKKRKKTLRDLSTEPIIVHDVNKLLNNVNNHSSPSVPKFNFMTSRPNENKILPSFMQKTYDRNSLNNTTGKTLLLNNYSNGQLNSNYDTICQKKSFNWVINRNLLNTDLSIKALTENIKKEDNAFIRKLGYYRNNLDDWTKGLYTSRFDRITLKTIPSKHKLNKIEEKKFTLNFS